MKNDETTKQKTFDNVGSTVLMASIIYSSHLQLRTHEAKTIVPPGSLENTSSTLIEMWARYFIKRSIGPEFCLLDLPTTKADKDESPSLSLASLWLTSLGLLDVLRNVRLASDEAGISWLCNSLLTLPSFSNCLTSSLCFALVLRFVLCALCFIIFALCSVLCNLCSLLCALCCALCLCSLCFVLCA